MSYSDAVNRLGKAAVEQAILGVGQMTTGSLSVTVNGTLFPYPREAIKSMGDLVEYVRSSIDPDSIIIGMSLNEQVLSDNDWRVPLSATNGKLNIQTGSRETYINERLSSASLYIDRIVREFQQTRLLFQNAEIQPANVALGKAVQDMRAFIEWYQTILQMLVNPSPEEIMKFKETVNTLTDICEQILQQQLYRSWWAIAETLEKKLEPQLELVKFACLSVFRQQGGVSNQ